MSKRDEIVEAMKNQLDELNAQIDGLEKQASAGREKLGASYDQQMAQLREASQAVMKKIDQIRAAGDERWEALAVLPKPKGQAIEPIKYERKP